MVYGGAIAPGLGPSMRCGVIAAWRRGVVNAPVRAVSDSVSDRVRNAPAEPSETFHRMIAKRCTDPSELCLTSFRDRTRAEAAERGAVWRRLDARAIPMARSRARTYHEAMATHR